MPEYPFPKPYRQEPDGDWLVHTLRGLKRFTDPELAWSTYHFSRLIYEKHQTGR